MKLVIQIPCFNEEASIGALLDSLPITIKGVDEIVTILLDDCSNDKSVEIASKYDIKIISFKKRLGLSNVFKIGVEEALKNDADILVNIDGDNQYSANSIKDLIEPILSKKADITVGARPIDNIKSFSPVKKILQKLGSFIAKFVSRIDIQDAPSGFRAFNRKAMLNINIFNPFTYTVEMLIQAYIKNLVVQNVKIQVNEQKNRKSKLFKNDFVYILKQAKNLVRFFIVYRPARFFVFFGLILFIIGFIIGARFLYYSTGHIQSLILCAIILSLSFVCFALAILGDLLSINRKLLEEIRYDLRCQKYKK